MIEVDHRIALACDRERLDNGIDDARVEQLYAVSIEGWDYTWDRSTSDPVNFGMWRTPLLLSGRSLAEIDAARLPVIHPEMTKAELYNGHWRLARILPEAPYTYQELVVKTNRKNPYGMAGNRAPSPVGRVPSARF